MKVVIVTDIFGLCASTDNLVSFLNNLSSDVTVIDPYQEERHSFSNEADAYRTFTQECGHDNYLAIAKKTLPIVKPKLIIGFSAGANAVWRISNSAGSYCKKMLCFYPTQIRNHLHIRPKISIDVIFPHQEKSFDVNTLNKKIMLLDNVRTEVTSYDHGFMNQCSKAYNADGNGYGLSLIEKQILVFTRL